MWLGIIVNWLVAVPALLFPNALLRGLGQPPSDDIMWTAFAANELILMSLLYLPSALDPHRYKLTALIVLAVLGVIIGVVAWYNFFRVVPEPAWVNQDLKTHFMYASIGTEGKEGIPFWIFIILPKMFPEYLPAPGGYASLGMLWE